MSATGRDSYNNNGYIDTRGKNVNWLRRAWKAIRRLYAVLAIVRFSILIPAMLVLTLLFADQMTDALIAESESRTEALASLIATLFAALIVWYTARTMLRFRFAANPASDPHSHPALKRHLPRLLAISVPAALLVKVWTLENAVSDETGIRHLAIEFVALTLVTALYVYLRRALARLLKFTMLAEQENVEKRNLRSLTDLRPTTRLVFWILMVANIVALALAIYGLISGIGAPAILLLALGLIAVTGSGLVYVSNHHRVPILSLLLLWTIICSPFNDNHSIRQTGQSHSHGVLTRSDPIAPEIPPESSPLRTQSLEEYFEAWWAELARHEPGDKPIPVVIVAADGGGIRAAYWTAAILAELEDRSSKSAVPFSRHVFAISGISGGSLGAATFAAMVAHRVALPDLETRTYVQEANDVLGRDFLSPTLANALFPDLLQRFLPFPVFDDRAIALEQSWERAWAAAHPSDAQRFADRFDRLWSLEPHRVPLLFLNGTIVESGDRSIMDPFANPAIISKSFSSVVRLAQVLGTQIPVSTAVLTSARFTYVSPAGLFGPTAQSSVRQRVVDGGYFDNSGGITARQIVAATAAAASGATRTMRLVVLHIGNAPPNEGRSGGNSLGSLPGGRVWLGETLSPVRALLDVRGAHAEQAVDDLNESSAGYEFHDVKLYRTGTVVPLGWALSCEVQKEMERQLVDCPANAADCGANTVNDVLTSLYGASIAKPVGANRKAPICTQSNR
jgi:hypothetical protein